MTLKIDERIQSSSIEIVDWPLSRVFFKNESRFPWFVLVPRVEGVEKLHELSEQETTQLMMEISKLSHIVKARFNPVKVNVAALGNMVRQLHIHVVGRDAQDPYWPHSIWQSSYEEKPYTRSVLIDLQNQLRKFFAEL